MADYNVQMKQYNGTSFDNILPYASQALTLAGGGSATEIIAQARAGLSQIASGSYVGNGNWDQNYSVTLNLGFKPRLVFIFLGNLLEYQEADVVNSVYAGYIVNAVGSPGNFFNAKKSISPTPPLVGVWMEELDRVGIYSYREGGSRYYGAEVVFTASNTGLSWKIVIATGANSYPISDNPNASYYIPSYLFNKSSITYNYIAFG